MAVNQFDRHNEVFEVVEMPSGRTLAVDLSWRVCDCSQFQVDRLPCRHVFACCANQSLDWHVYVHDVWKMSELHKVYKYEFAPMGIPSTLACVCWGQNDPKSILEVYRKRSSEINPLPE
ncbi:hypothetical protein PIB30_035687 [Stylosanthes scabra]|uniref:SWIM-type domain-containing protein n=1 Tax=Stylosanthes scabra TaxID=79078 RepID=A0ABU6UFX9_9FABA|nr:hypothetical protein [Stylosanthes scabra]